MSVRNSRLPRVKSWSEQIESDQLFNWALRLCPVWGFLVGLLTYQLSDTGDIGLVVGLCVTVVSAIAVLVWKEDAIFALRELLKLFR